MLFQVKAYLKFLWKSTNHHGIHSPFVFDLVSKCFYDKTVYPEYRTLENFRKSLFTSHDIIDVTDFGAGSRIFKSNKRHVSKIAKTAGITSQRAELLFRITRYFKPDEILEIGTSLGLATSALSLGNPLATVTTLEGCPETVKIARLQFEKFNLGKVESVVTEFDGYLQNQQSSISPQLIYFDGNHQNDATLRYFDMLLPTVTNDSVWIFDDIHWSSDMEQAWEMIKQHPKVTVTIDTFQWGFVFFRMQQQKQHFVVRA